MTDGSVQSDVVEPVHPLQGRQLKRFFGFPEAPAVNEFGLAVS
jgi:hypothetical protein